MSKRFQKKTEQPQPKAAAAPVSKPAKRPSKQSRHGPLPFSVGLKDKPPEDDDDGIEPPKLTDTIDGRATGPITIEHVLEQLGQMWATTREVSAFLRITEKTLFKLFRNEPRAKELYERGKLMGNVSQRRRNIALAEKNAVMSIFLSKNHLGMRDQFDMRGEISHEHNVLVTLFQKIGEGNHGKIIEGEVLPAPAAGKKIEEDA